MTRRLDRKRSDRRRVIRRMVAAAAFVGAIGLVGCGGSNMGASGSGGQGAAGGAGAGSGGAPIGEPACPDLFRQDQVLAFDIEISPDTLAAINGEFKDLASLQNGNDFVSKHPVVLHFGNETISSATFKLHGQSSWMQTVMFDGARAKMQFDIAFQSIDEAARFHGVGKLAFDMPRSDWTFLHDRLAHAWLRRSGIAAGCASSARVSINGAFYGVFVVEEPTSRRVIQEFFPSDPDGDLWKGGLQPETNHEAPSWDRQAAFWAAKDMTAVAATVDVGPSVREWAVEALLNNADGYYGGNHNFYLYETRAGFVFLPNDTDSTFDWLALFDMTPANAHPVYWWEGRSMFANPPGPTWLAVMNDPTSRKKYVDALAAEVDRWDVALIQGWIDTWSSQIAADVAADPHTWATPDQVQNAVATARRIVAERAQFVRTFLDCESGAAGAADRDGDGAKWCGDCRDDDSSIHPGAAEVCGNGLDDDCNGLADDCR